jgi:DNA-binding MurR/RpiR family transcriptional regulator
METKITQEELQAGFDGFQRLKLKMSESNRKYRKSENGKNVTKILHKKWTDSKKTDEDYQKNINKNQRERYRVRKLEKMEKLEKLEKSLDDILEENLEKK